MIHKSISLPKNLWKSIAIKAKKNGVSIGETVREIIRQHFGEVLAKHGELK